MNNIRNFSIIAHIDHGKSTLADRMLEVTGTIEKRKMREQVLDAMDLERERGITIKMTPVRMIWKSGYGDARNTEHEASNKSHIQNSSQEFVLNLIDTPGHVDFSYEVSRALKAVEGVVLLVDATAGVQAQTITTLEMARAMNLVIVPVVSKIDSPLARTREVKVEVAELLQCPLESVIEVSGKTGEGVPGLLQEIVLRVPSPREASGQKEDVQALVFDFQYSEHQGIIVYTRVFKGAITKESDLLFAVSKERITPIEIGIFAPEPRAGKELRAGEIGYVITGVKEPSKGLVGDTLTKTKHPSAPLPGYERPQPVVWASLYPESQDNFGSLRKALERLQLSDASLQFEEERSFSLGRGFRSGFLGMLHLEIIIERLRREFNLKLIVTPPTIVYEVLYKNGKREKIYSPSLFPDHGAYEKVYEPITRVKIITPADIMSDVIQIMYAHEATVGESRSFGGSRVMFEAEMPLRELMRGFFEEVKRVSSGYASFSYDFIGFKEAHVLRLDILVAEEVVPAFSHIVAEKKSYNEARRLVDRLYEVLPKALFVVKIQGKANGRILASKTLSALKKDVTGYLYGGDITRKRKLWEKQKRGKKKLKERGGVHIPHEVFLKMLKQGD